MIVRAEKLRRGFTQLGSYIPVLHDLDLCVHRGETVAVVGESGSGKSTLLSLLSGLERAESGRLTIDNRDILAMTENELTAFRASRIGIVFQNYHLMEGLTALENVSLPLELAGDTTALTRARQLLDQIGLTDRFSHFPSQLSGGECQRVAIARGIVTNPSILLADEPSGSLDARTGDRVMNLLFDLVAQHSTTMLLVTHSTSLARRCTRFLRLQHGQLTEVS